MSTSHLIIILIIVLVLFGAERIPKIMHDLGKGFKSFKDGMDSSLHDVNHDNKK